MCISMIQDNLANILEPETAGSSLGGVMCGLTAFAWTSVDGQLFPTPQGANCPTVGLFEVCPG